MAITRRTRDGLRRMSEWPSMQTGPFAKGGCVPELLDALDAAEARVADLESRSTRLDAVLELHQPTNDGLSCCTCMGELGAAADWPCPTAEAGRAARAAV